MTNAKRKWSIFLRVIANVKDIVNRMQYKSRMFKDAGPRSLSRLMMHP